MIKADLHTHSTASDGALSPTQIIDKALAKKLDAVAITDHDAPSGLEEAENYANGKITFVPGIEIGCNEPSMNMFEIHLVGLFIDSKNKQLQELSKNLLNCRIEQKKGIIKKLNDLGYEIALDELKERCGENLNRPKIAEILVEKYPELKDIQNVFDKLIGFGKPAFAIQKKPLIKEAIEVIHEAGGFSFLAHPKAYIHSNEIIEKFMKEGGKGIEVNYPYKIINDLQNEEQLIKEIKELATKNNLLISGGTDYHRETRGVDLGEYGLTKQEIEELLNKTHT